AMEEFDAVLGEGPNQVADRPRDDVSVSVAELLAIPDTPGEVTEEGLLGNVRVGVEYISSWLGGNGAVAIDNLMEDAATAEIARSQVWQWVRHGEVTAERAREIADEQPAGDARELFERVALSDDFVEFLTLPAYERLVRA